MKVNNKKVVMKRSGIEEWEMMLRLQFYYDDSTSAAIIREAKELSENGGSASSSDYIILYSGIYQSYTVFVINHKYDGLAMDIEGLGQMKSPKTVRDYVAELVMHDGKLIDDDNVDCIMNCRLIDKRESKKLFNKTKSIYGIVWELTRTLLDRQRENSSLKKQIMSLKYDLERAYESMVENTSPEEIIVSDEVEEEENNE